MMTGPQLPWYLRPAYWFSRRPRTRGECLSRVLAMLGMVFAVMLLGVLVASFDPGFASARDAVLVGAVLFVVGGAAGFFALLWLWRSQPQEPPEGPAES